MLSRMQAFLVLWVWVVASAAAAQESTDEAGSGGGGEWAVAEEPSSETDNERPAAEDEDIRAELEALRAEVEALKQQNKEREPAGTTAPPMADASTRAPL